MEKALLRVARRGFVPKVGYILALALLLCVVRRGFVPIVNLSSTTRLLRCKLHSQHPPPPSKSQKNTQLIFLFHVQGVYYLCTGADPPIFTVGPSSQISGNKSQK